MKRLRLALIVLIALLPCACFPGVWFHGNEEKPAQQEEVAP